VLGQVYGTYNAGVDRLMRMGTETGILQQDGINWAIRHGFLAPGAPGLTSQAAIYRYWFELQRAWVRELQPA
jgi:hypothetical protein